MLYSLIDGYVIRSSIKLHAFPFLSHLMTFSLFFTIAHPAYVCESDSGIGELGSGGAEKKKRQMMSSFTYSALSPSHRVRRRQVSSHDLVSQNGPDDGERVIPSEAPTGDFHASNWRSMWKG